MYQMANLKPDELQAIKDVEQQLKSRLNEEIVLIAWKGEAKDKTEDTHRV